MEEEFNVHNFDEWRNGVYNKNGFTRYYDGQSKQDFLKLNDKVFEAMKTNKRVKEDQLYVKDHGVHYVVGRVFEIEGDYFAVTNNGVVATWKEVRL